MKLSETLAQAREASKSRIPEDRRKILIQGIEDLKASGITDRSLKQGDAAPDFTLPDASGNDVNSAELRGGGALVITFYRGGWCPYCNFELKALQEKLPEIRDLGAQMVAISPETPDRAADTASKNEVSFPVLSDAGNRVARQFGLVFELPETIRPIYLKMGIDLPTQNGDGSFELPVPATYVVGSDGMVKLAAVDADYRYRLDPEEVIAALKG